MLNGGNGCQVGGNQSTVSHLSTHPEDFAGPNKTQVKAAAEMLTRAVQGYPLLQHAFYDQSEMKSRTSD
jgi:hypothetical protein